MIDRSQTDLSTAPMVLASRKSKLAMAQTEEVRRSILPVPAEILGLSTTGDEVLDRPLVDVGGKGVFIKTLEGALLDGRADAAVHSLKDMETHIAPGTEIAAVLPREDRADALVGRYRTIDELPSGARIGTASVRRAACLRHHRPDLEIALLRGNVNSRIARLVAGEFAAIILAMAGLNRLKPDCEYHRLDETIMPTAAAQGVIAVQIKSSGSRADAVRACLLLPIVQRQQIASLLKERFLQLWTGPAVPLYRLWLIWMLQADYRYRQRCYLLMGSRNLQLMLKAAANRHNRSVQNLDSACCKCVAAKPSLPDGLA